MKHYLILQDSFLKESNRIVRANPILANKIRNVLKTLTIDPFYKGLKTHKVESKLFGRRYSSRVSGDIRIIWDFDAAKRKIILLLTIGGHSGKHQVYR